MAENDDLEMQEGSEDDSDVELEGVDMDADVVEEDALVGRTSYDAATDIGVAAMTAADSSGGAVIEELDDDEAKALAAEEAAELEAARTDRLELMNADEQKQKQATNNKQPAADVQSRLDYLLHQSDVFAHFLAGSVAASTTTSTKKSGKGGGKGAGRGKGRLTEEEEDAQLLKSAQSKRRVVRLDHQPACLAPICKMHPYQLEGLNWLIKLHDHGINAILADGRYQKSMTDAELSFLLTLVSAFNMAL
jgi:hypothetical protein